MSSGLGRDELIAMAQEMSNATVAVTQVSPEDPRKSPSSSNPSCTPKSAKHTNAPTAGPRVGSAAMMSLLLPSAARVKYTIMHTLGGHGVQVHGVCVVDGEVGVDVRVATPLVLACKIDSILFEKKQIWKHIAWGYVVHY